MLELNEDAKYLQYDSDQDDRESIATVSTSLLSFNTENSDLCASYKIKVEEFSDTDEIIFTFDGEVSEGESDKLSQFAKSEDHETENAESDREVFEDRVYLEYDESEIESVGSELQTNSYNETSSIPESEEPDPEELKSLVESYKTPKFPHCDVCNIVFRTLEQLNEHSSVHDSQEIVTCEVCKNIIHKDSYNIHLKVHKVLYNQRLAKKYKKSECTVCGKYVSKSYMKIHMLQHGTEEEKAKRFKKCTICNAPIFASYLKDHMKRVHKQNKEPKAEKFNILKRKCPVCCRMFRESTYKAHVASHARTQKTYVCEECGREFFSKSTFATHSLIHKDEYKYKCQFCPYQGKHLGLLKVHVRTHTKDYSYKCTTCGASFITKSNLNAHQKVHSSKVMFICSECGKCFRRERTLRSHMVSIHEGIKAFACDLCGKKYGSKVTMVAHKKRVHNVAGPSRVGQTPSYLLRAQGNATEDGS